MGKPNRSFRRQFDEKHTKPLPASGLFIFIFVVLTFGLAGTVWFLVTTLQDNSEKIQSYKMAKSTSEIDQDIVTASQSLFKQNSSILGRDSFNGSQKLYKEARRLFDQGAYKECIDFAAKSLAYYENGDIAKASDLDKSEIVKRFRLMAQCQLALGDMKQAIFMLDRGLAFEPNKIELYQMRADALQRLGDYSGAHRDRLRASELQKNEPILKRVQKQLILEQEKHE